MLGDIRLRMRILGKEGHRRDIITPVEKG